MKRFIKHSFYFLLLATFTLFFGKIIYDIIYPIKLMNDDIFNNLKVEYFVVEGDKIKMKIRLPKHVPYKILINNINVIVLEKDDVVAQLKIPPIHISYSSIIFINTRDIKLTINEIMPKKDLRVKFTCDFSINYLMRPTKLPISLIYVFPVGERGDPFELSLHNFQLENDHINIQVRFLINIFKSILPSEIEIYGYVFTIYLNGKPMKVHLNYYGNRIYNLYIFLNDHIENIIKDILDIGLEHLMIDDMPLFTDPIVLFDFRDKSVDYREFLNINLARVSNNQAHFDMFYGRCGGKDFVKLNIDSEHFHIAADLFFIFKDADVHFGITLIFTLYDLENFIIDFVRTNKVFFSETNFNLRFYFDLTRGIFFNDLRIYDMENSISLIEPIFHHGLSYSASGISIKSLIYKKNGIDLLSNINICFDDILFPFESDFYSGRIKFSGRVGIHGDFELSVRTDVFFTKEFFSNNIKLKNHLRFQILENEVDILTLLNSLPDSNEKKHVVLVDSHNLDDITITLNLPFLQNHYIEMSNEEPIIFRLNHNHYCQFVFENFTLTIRNINIIFEAPHYILALDQSDILSRVIWQLIVELLSFTFTYVMSGDDKTDLSIDIKHENMKCYVEISEFPFIPVSLQLREIDYLNIKIFLSEFYKLKINILDIYEESIKSQNIIVRFRGGGNVEIPLSFLFYFVPKFKQSKKKKQRINYKNITYHLKDRAMFFNYRWKKMPFDLNVQLKGKVFKQLDLERSIAISGRRGKYIALKIPLTQPIINFGGDFVTFFIIDSINSGWQYINRPKIFAYVRNYFNSHVFQKLMNYWPRTPIRSKPIFALNLKTNTFMFLVYLPLRRFRDRNIIYIFFLFTQIRIITVRESPYVAIEIINSDKYNKVPRLAYNDQHFFYNSDIFEDFMKIFRVLFINGLIWHYRNRALIYKYVTNILLLYLNKTGRSVRFFPLREFVFY